MLYMECHMCKYKNSNSSKLLSIRIINNEIRRIMNDIPQDFIDYRRESKLKNLLNTHSSSYKGLCGRNCQKDYNSLKLEEEKMFKNISKIVCFNNENDDKLNLMQLKNCCRGEYGFIYTILDNYKRFI